MKTTDLAMIFIAIIIPIAVVVYVDVSFLLKKEEATLYYKNIIDSAIDDATYAMKNVENIGQDIDYGYSGVSENKVAVNANVAVDTFFESLFDNFEIKGDKTAEEYIKSHIPVIAIVDYNGVYIYSMDTYSEGKNIDYILKPKRYFTYTYAVTTTGIKAIEQFSDDLDDSVKPITVIFTMDDYIGVIGDNSAITWFYLEDSKNNSILCPSNPELIPEVVEHLKYSRSQVISSIVSDEMSFAVSNHNLYSDTDYEFVFPSISVSDWDDMVSNIGIISFIQGINIGNEKLNYVGHGISGLKTSEKYYVSKARSGIANLDYYHNSTSCYIYIGCYKEFRGYFTSKVDAAASGYYPCPICNP